MNKIQILFCLFFIICGIFCGQFLWHTWHYCLEIHSPRALFYGPFSEHLKQELSDMGYSFSCPAFLPSTNLQFIHTRKDYEPIPIPSKDWRKMNIAIIGDCFEAFDLTAIDSYQFVLPINEYHHGYLSQFNYKTAFYAIHNSGEKILCNTNFAEQNIDVHAYAIWLDAIIQGFKNEKI